MQSGQGTQAGELGKGASEGLGWSVWLQLTQDYLSTSVFVTLLAFAAFPTPFCSHFPLVDANVWRHHGRVSVSQPPLGWQLPCESISHLLGGSCKLNGLHRAAESCEVEVQGKCKGFAEGGRWRERPTHCLGHYAGSFVEHFMLIAAWVQNATQAKWWQFAPPPFLLSLYQIQCQDKMKLRSS